MNIRTERLNNRSMNLQLGPSNNSFQQPTGTSTRNNTNNLASSSDIAGEVTLKTSVDMYQLLKMNELIKNAAAWRARMPKASKFDKYFDSKDNPTNPSTPKVQINEATLAHWQLWDKLPRTSGIPKTSSLRQWKCTSTLETSI